MRIDYIAPSSDGLWHNDTSPAINETNLNHLEKEVKDLINEVNTYVVENETELQQMKQGDGKLLTKTQEELLTSFDEQPTEGSSKLVKSSGIYTFVIGKLSTVQEIASQAKAAVEAIKKAFPGGEIKELSAVASSGSYNDLKDKLTAGENITIVNNIISSTGGGGSKIPVQSSIPVQKEGDIWFRTFEN